MVRNMITVRQPPSCSRSTSLCLVLSQTDCTLTHHYDAMQWTLLRKVSGVMFVFSRQQKGKKSVSNFDPEFTKEPCRLSPVDHNVIAAIEDEVFEGFSFTNPQMFTAS